MIEVMSVPFKFRRRKVYKKPSLAMGSIDTTHQREISGMDFEHESRCELKIS